MKYSRTPRISAVIALICLVLALVTIAPAGASETHTAQVRDISDRAYQRAIIDLITGAEESIVISLYILVPSEKGPVAMLLKDLEDALGRGVSVEIYLNTKFGSRKDVPTFDEEPFRRLEKKGASINPVSKTAVHHDKLIIVDSRYVVEGSHNWSINALKQSHESSTLIDSPPLAREKLERLRGFTLEEDRQARLKKLEELKNAPALPGDFQIPLPRALLEDKNYLPGMLAHREKRTFNAYFLVLLRGYTVGRGSLPEEFPVSLEKLANDLEVPSYWSMKRKRWQKAAEALRELRDDYGLIDIDFKYGQEEWVSIKNIPGDTFSVGVGFFEPGRLNSMSTRGKFVYLLKEMLKQEGKGLDSYTREELSRRYHIGLKSLRYGIREVGE